MFTNYVHKSTSGELHLELELENVYWLVHTADATRKDSFVSSASVV